MSEPHLYSVRMRASDKGRHLSGAERLVPPPQLAVTADELVQRAIGKGIRAEQIVITIDAVSSEQVQYIRALDVVSVRCEDVARCRSLARSALQRIGISPVAVQAAMDALDDGPSRSGGNMRGAMIMDARTGERLEEDQERGIRASRFDWSEITAGEVRERLAGIGLTHKRTQEALALATKVAQAPGIVAELCWSDDPDYVAGYVAGPRTGYVRLPALKQQGISRGGRAFFVDRSSWTQELFQSYLQRTPVLISSIGTIRMLDPEQELSW
jgi:6-carboxyhexanoate--CoA ligase